MDSWRRPWPGEPLCRSRSSCVREGLALAEDAALCLESVTGFGTLSDFVLEDRAISLPVLLAVR